MRKIMMMASVLLGAASLASPVLARDQIRAVGSSTVYPFITTAAEDFGRSTPFTTPIVESTGTGGGFKLFCEGTAENTPDISNASRAIKNSELELCAKNGVKKPLEINIGYDGIVFSNTIKNSRFKLTKHQIFLALARQVPINGKLVDNPYKSWNDIDASLPKQKIEVYGPPPTSGTRDAFAELVMDKACVDLPEFVAAYPDKDVRGKTCQLLREDGAYVEAGENDNLIVQKLTSNPNALGIFGYSAYEQNMATIQAATVNGIAPSFESILDGSYPVSRPLFIYVKNEHLSSIKGLKEFVLFFVGDSVMGPEGSLSLKGLIPLDEAKFEKVHAAVEKALGK